MGVMITSASVVGRRQGVILIFDTKKPIQAQEGLGMGIVSSW